jgi:hypothetical protein
MTDCAHKRLGRELAGEIRILANRREAARLVGAPWRQYGDAIDAIRRRMRANAKDHDDEGCTS